MLAAGGITFEREVFDTLGAAVPARWRSTGPSTGPNVSS